MLATATRVRSGFTYEQAEAIAVSLGAQRVEVYREMGQHLTVQYAGTAAVLRSVRKALGN